jgi:hypothetical protein
MDTTSGKPDPDFNRAHFGKIAGECRLFLFVSISDQLDKSGLDARAAEMLHRLALTSLRHLHRHGACIVETNACVTAKAGVRNL